MTVEVGSIPTHSRQFVSPRAGRMPRESYPDEARPSRSRRRSRRRPGGRRRSSLSGAADGGGAGYQPRLGPTRAPRSRSSGRWRGSVRPKCPATREWERRQVPDGRHGEQHGASRSRPALQRTADQDDHRRRRVQLLSRHGVARKEGSAEESQGTRRASTRTLSSGEKRTPGTSSTRRPRATISGGRAPCGSLRCSTPLSTPTCTTCAP